VSRLARRPRTDHAQTAATLRDQPGVWLPVGEYRARTTADSIAGMIRAARNNCQSGFQYAPAGSFEARTELTDTGTQVMARYIGPP
jgi:hypothetical protein